ncbi:MAG TPA: hypothetical protein VJT08_02740 [Terriglobales bacterium]|nr:hypothetical protein [Terriglobales bacterium]
MLLTARDRWKLFPILFILVTVVYSSTASTALNAQNSDQERLESKRRAFASGRDLLLQKGVPFDPDELLRYGWEKRLKSVLDTIPEMKESRFESKPLQGVYMADTLYLPEKAELAERV